MKKYKYFLLISAMLLNLSCSNDSDDGDVFSLKFLKKSSLTVDNGEHSYDIEWKDNAPFWGTEYKGTVGDNVISEPMPSDQFLYEEEWFSITATEDHRKITIHVSPNTETPELERTIIVNVRSGNRTSQFTLTQKE